jgi:hypothetical protein
MCQDKPSQIRTILHKTSKIQKLHKLASWNYFVYSFIFSISLIYISEEIQLAKVKRMANELQVHENQMRELFDVRKIFKPTQNMSIENENNVTLLVSTNENPEIILKKTVLQQNNISEIFMNREKISNSRPYSKFTIIEDSEYKTIKPTYSLKPMKYKLSLESFTQKPIDINLNVHYLYDPPQFRFNDNAWYQNPSNWIDIRNNGIFLVNNSNNIVRSLSFKRRFENDVSIEFTFVPYSKGISFSVFLGEATSVMFGEPDNRTISIKQAKKDDKYYNRKEITANQAKYEGKFLQGNSYRARILRKDNRYTILLGKDNEELKQILEYIDITPQKNIEENFKSVGFASWHKGYSVLIKRIIIKDII